MFFFYPIIDASSLEVEKRSDKNVIIESDGTVKWAPRGQYKTLCAVEDGKPVCNLRLVKELKFNC